MRSFDIEKEDETEGFLGYTQNHTISSRTTASSNASKKKQLVGMTMVCCAFLVAMTIRWTARSLPSSPSPQANQVVYGHAWLKGPKRTCTPPERRALARQGPTASEADWKSLTECIVRTGATEKLGHFHMHVSKVAGSAMCSTLERACPAQRGEQQGMGCEIAPTAQQGPNWCRAESLPEEFGFPVCELKPDPDYTCEDLVLGMGRKRHTFAMFERNVVFRELPKNDTLDFPPALCDQTINSINFREPLARIVSHYKMLLEDWGWCHTEACREQCIAESPGAVKFNVSTLINVFDVISDNYFTRSLNPVHVYKHKGRLADHPQADTHLLPYANATLHAFDWVFLLDNTPEEKRLLLESGMGLPPNSSTMLVTNTAGSGGKGKSKTWNSNRLEEHLTDVGMLRELNRLDLALWEQAQTLNRLDLYAAQRMQPYVPGLQRQVLDEIHAIDPRIRCCGNACLQNPYFGAFPGWFP